MDKGKLPDYLVVKQGNIVELHFDTSKGMMNWLRWFSRLTTPPPRYDAPRKKPLRPVLHLPPIDVSHETTGESLDGQRIQTPLDPALGNGLPDLSKPARSEKPPAE